MGKKGGAGENSKKAQGQARKADAAASKAAAEDAKKSAAEAAEWEKGAKKGNAKKENAEEKKAEAARKKAEREALLAEEEKNTPGRSAPKNAKSAVKKTKGLDQALGQLDGRDQGPLSALNASGIEEAIDALGLTDSSSKVTEIDKHPERRIGKAYKTWKENNPNREKELQKQGFAYNKRQDVLYQEFLESPDNPMKQVSAKYNATREELQAIQAEEKRKIEERLGSKRGA
uniref:Partner of vegetative incompatibility protein 6 n=1 Tax=Cryphonectria parasitica TaxID=5116 RepID=G8H3Q0_CRYPA|nr:partner of vegetative incompatibility protein 6 [Cryphonectria parasitica]